MPRALMVQGTGSNVGKSVLVTALCRILRQDGWRVAPFKAQNMALNAFVTADGGEIGMAQAVQAQAAGVEPTADMNPVLLKPTGDRRAQVILRGRVAATLSAQEYHGFLDEARAAIRTAWAALAPLFDVVVLEGAGSPAEVNLRERDLANMFAAELAGAPVVLVGDIDRGGVFAWLVGTLHLLRPDERARVAGFVINKFRGDAALLEPGLRFLEREAGKPVLGVLPYLTDLRIAAEDSLALRDGCGEAGAEVRIAVVRLPRIANFTDLDPLTRVPGVALRFVDEPAGLAGADLVVLPGTKTTIADLAWVRARGLDAALAAARGRGACVLGICGGFQMLGRRLHDPAGIEGAAGSADGLGLLDAETTFEPRKITERVSGRIDRAAGTLAGAAVEGYEIHLGRTVRGAGAGPFARIERRGGAAASDGEGAVSADGRVWGTYVHGFLESPGVACALVNGLRAARGLAPLAAGSVPDARAEREAGFDALAAAVRHAVDVPRVYGILGIGKGR